jgi:hypothetical protein
MNSDQDAKREEDNAGGQHKAKTFHVANNSRCSRHLNDFGEFRIEHVLVAKIVEQDLKWFMG